ncbi:ATPase [Sphaerisporangium melleum]|uniref:ATPase n=2 Tax=Sphaerisporangium melleum TaxID=321316 RepID=A0A917RGJ8_9ACTN|nr:ATPase [Sphaerisporangium melleum]GII68738.1 ATPase [Sphaerisporangium melleum]
MTGEESRALGAIRFNWAELPDDVWRPSPFHVDGLHRATTQMLLDGLAAAGESVDASPIGVVMQGQRGSGKTHLLGWMRERTQEEGGYFFLVELLDARDFWESVALSMLDGLAREIDGESQLRMFLLKLSSLVGVQRLARRELTGKAALTKETLDVFVDLLRRFHPRVGRETQDTLRALVLQASNDLNAQDVGYSYLSCRPEGEPGERARWGMRHDESRPATEIVRDVSRLLALTGPSVIAVDQIDTLISQSHVSSQGETAQSRGENETVERIAHGLMTLREVTRRTLTVLSCLPATWMLIETVATDSVQDRFRQATPLKTIPDAKIGHRLVERRFTEVYRKARFHPPYPTWPVRPSAFDGATGFTARQLLITIDTHVRACLAAEEIIELEDLNAPTALPAGAGNRGADPAPHELAVLDARFGELRERADFAGALEADTEDAVMPALLAAGLTAWIAGRGEDGQAFTQDGPPSAKPSLHARLRRSLAEDTEDEAHWAFRAVTADHPNAALNRLRTACVAAGLNAGTAGRRLFVLRNTQWSKGERTQEVLARFERAGGRTLRVEDEDVRTLAALRDLLAENDPRLPVWLVARDPAGGVKVLNEALADVWTVPDRQDARGHQEAEPATQAESPSPVSVGQGTVPAGPAGGRDAAGSGSGGPGRAGAPGGAGVSATVPSPGGTSSGEATGSFGTAVTLGRATGDGTPVTVDLATLRRHTAIFAGSGSGKTVLIRRLVEECALRGVSSIVLDPNNDLARLGEAWPQKPSLWAEGDDARAEEYLANTDVVVWTPLREGGRPLAFQPLPDFSGVADDPDEFNEAVNAAVASLAPRAKLVGNTPKAHQGLAVLREALIHHGRRGTTTLRGLIALLSDLPDGISELAGARKLAADIAQNLTAAMVNDPLFGGSGATTDPGVLLTPPPGRRARVSVVSLVGLPSDEQRQSFVNQLQMALFAWIRRNPAAGRPLGGLFVMDEAQIFAPAGAATPCTRSTLALASQARKYGLGLVFATQAPKGLHNHIPGNAATQFFGLLNAPVQIAAAKEMARTKGGNVAEVGRLGAGEFYVAAEGAGFRRIQAPLCLSHHPEQALTAEEVVARARVSSPSAG